jgi:hypothetical protein
MQYLEPSAPQVISDFREQHHCDFWQHAFMPPAPSADGL